jgi:hypothetical protein
MRQPTFSELENPNGRNLGKNWEIAWRFSVSDQFFLLIAVKSFSHTKCGKTASDGMRILLLSSRLEKKSNICSGFKLNRAQIKEFRKKEFTSFFLNSINIKGGEFNVLCWV